MEAETAETQDAKLPEIFSTARLGPQGESAVAAGEAPNRGIT